MKVSKKYNYKKKTGRPPLHDTDLTKQLAFKMPGFQAKAIEDKVDQMIDEGWITNQSHMLRMIIMNSINIVEQIFEASPECKKM